MKAPTLTLGCILWWFIGSVAWGLTTGWIWLGCRVVMPEELTYCGPWFCGKTGAVCWLVRRVVLVVAPFEVMAADARP